MESTTETRAEQTERVWREFHDRLRLFLVARAADAADDILQNVFIKVHTSIDSLRDESKITPWLYQITRNAIADHFRQRTTEPLDDESELEAPAQDHSAERRLAESLSTMIEELPAPYREAVTLTELGGLTQAELARRLGLSLSGAKSRVQRGRERLKQMLLDCCHVELDRHGGIVDYYERATCCHPVKPVGCSDDEGCA